jgi:hypothetical protein
MVNATPQPLYPQTREQVCTVQEAGWAPGQFWTAAKNFSNVQSYKRIRKTFDFLYLLAMFLPRPPLNR